MRGKGGGERRAARGNGGRKGGHDVLGSRLKLEGRKERAAHTQTHTHSNSDITEINTHIHTLAKIYIHKTRIQKQQTTQ